MGFVVWFGRKERPLTRLISFTQPWIPRKYHREIVQRLLDFGLITFDNARNLPLKSGGTTDIYITIRDARNNPKALRFMAELFAQPLSQLEIDRFVEVPDSVSCFAGTLSVLLNKPYLTIREQAKEGRVANAKVIGHVGSGEQVALIDDVITDGASKIGPYQECSFRGVIVQALVVLVDRQRERRWEMLGLPVWAGMTLHDVRRELIGLEGMQRCDPKIEEKNPIIVALDGKSWNEILPIVDQLRTTGCILKVNDLACAEGFDRLFPELLVYGRVMVDLKSHDIPNTVYNICKRIARHNIWAVTVHASGDAEMVEAAKRGLEGTNTLVLAVTVLTSLDDEKCKVIYGTRSRNTVRRLAFLAHTVGADGFICSPQEVRDLKAQFPDGKIFVTPGIRSGDKPTNDQARVATPQGAIDSGANYIVMGRQILGAADPVAEVKRVLVEELGIAL